MADHQLVSFDGISCTDLFADRSSGARTLFIGNCRLKVLDGKIHISHLQDIIPIYFREIDGQLVVDKHMPFIV